MLYIVGVEDNRYEVYDDTDLSIRRYSLDTILNNYDNGVQYYGMNEKIYNHVKKHMKITPAPGIDGMFVRRDSASSGARSVFYQLGCKRNAEFDFATCFTKNPYSTGNDLRIFFDGWLYMLNICSDCNVTCGVLGGFVTILANRKLCCCGYDVENNCILVRLDKRKIVMKDGFTEIENNSTYRLSMRFDRTKFLRKSLFDGWY